MAEVELPWHGKRAFMYWPSLSTTEIQERVHRALDQNLSYRRDNVLGLPGSYIDPTVFPAEPEMMKHAWLRAFVENPNHIGVHTLPTSEGAFAGTQELERDLLRICAEEILGAPAKQWDGYVASGGTESNLQALWTLRNMFRRQLGAGEVGVLCSADTHYSVPKGADLLDLSLFQVDVTPDERKLEAAAVRRAGERAWSRGVRHMIVVLNMGTTLFGSVDDPDPVLDTLSELGFTVAAHVDAAFGGFIYPFTAERNALSFADPRLKSFTLDAHKMLQAPYGTGIHIIRPGLMDFALTPEATYVPGLDQTLCGSRSGTNAVAVWMILMAYGSAGGVAWCRELLRITDLLCDGLRQRGVRFFRDPAMNLVTMRIEDVPAAIVERYQLVPDVHGPDAQWVKVVVMPHVEEAHIQQLLADLGQKRA